MTTNQTIDGVPCSDLELFLVYGTLTEESRAAGDRLRALLDARESCGACNSCTNGCRLDAESPPAAQPQGVPVAWQYRVSAGPQTGWSLWHDGKGEEFKQSYQVETRPLYAEQPAPVAPESINHGACVDLRVLLNKYIEHVGQCEGIDFISWIGNDRGSEVPFSPAEIAELEFLQVYPMTDKSALTAINLVQKP